MVLAAGNAGFPNMPNIPGMQALQGVEHHSSDHPGGETYAGKRCVVTGSNNSAHDICADLAEHGADVTMLQRSSTLVVRSETMLRLSCNVLYSEQAVAAGLMTERADLMTASISYRLSPTVQTPIWQQIAREDASFYKRLGAV